MKAARSAKIKAEAGFSQTLSYKPPMNPDSQRNMKAARSAKIKAEAGFSQTLSYKTVMICIHSET
jgi:hypothetical protein